jgi:hypothetical protein
VHRRRVIEAYYTLLRLCSLDIDYSPGIIKCALCFLFGYAVTRHQSRFKLRLPIKSAKFQFPFLVSVQPSEAFASARMFARPVTFFFSLAERGAFRGCSRERARRTCLSFRRQVRFGVDLGARGL